VTPADRRVVGLVDYKAGNIHSIENAFLHVGASVVRLHTEAELSGCTHVVLPGVGAFGFCADKLRATGIVPALHEWAFQHKRPLLGICVGMQLLADGSEESPDAAGLGWIGGNVRRIPRGEDVRVPHVGWNSVRFDVAYGEFAAGNRADFYFDHSFAYHNPTLGSTVGTCIHGEDFSAVVRRDNITAVQFHPEKSQASGLRFLSSYLRQ
jgi:imidazole glycerol-phosphate synthase subunit HisH